MSDTSDASTYSDYDDLSSEVEEYTKNVNDFELLIKEVEPYIIETRKEIDFLYRIIDKAIRQTNELKSRVLDIRKEKKICENNISVLKTKLQGLSANNDALQKMVTDGSATIAQITGNIIANNKRYKLLTEKLEKNLNQFDGANDEEKRLLVTLDEKQNLLENDLAALEQTLISPI